MNPVNHVAIIMDGNGRWGLKKKGSRNSGHRAGLNTVEQIIEETIKNKIKYLTLYTFSTENWKRPKKEISFLFKLLENFLLKKLDNLVKSEIKLKILGDKKKFSKKLQKSKRNELEITDLLKIYNKQNKLKYKELGRGAVWLDTGSIDDFYNASLFVSTIENRQGIKIACLEEIALNNKWISKKEIKNSIKFYGKCKYSNYLKSFL